MKCLLIAGRNASNTLYLLETFRWMGRQFQHFYDLCINLEIATIVMNDSKQSVLNYLQLSHIHLLNNLENSMNSLQNIQYYTQQLTLNGIDDLYHYGQSGMITLYFLE
jgi:hypothetical protein